jgi:MoxR-like ATPase
MSISSAKIDFWIANNLNVMLIGRHGVGKTAIVTDAFNRHNLKWRYFSASTMEPWCDFIGVPKEKNDNELCEQMKLVKQIAKINYNSAVSYIKQNWKLEESNAKELIDNILKDNSIAYLDLVRPYDFATDSVEALFFDEFNRSPKKIRNAVMELIQFKSINGRKFENLKIIWCAINPDDDESLKYDVETLDSAQIDRFQVSVKLPYEPNADWFRQKYGQRLADSALLWWKELDDVSKQLVSPRRLQYAVDCYIAKGDPRDVLPVISNVSKFVSSLRNGPITEIIDELVKNNNRTEARNLLENENFYSGALPHIVKSDTLQKFFVPLMPQEKIVALMSQNEKVCTHIIQNLDKVPQYHKSCKEILKANLDASLVKKLRRALTADKNLATAFAKESISDANENMPSKPFYNNKENPNIAQELQLIKKYPNDSIPQKIAIYEMLAKSICKTISIEDGHEIISILNLIFADSERQQIQKILIDPNFDKLFGMINHAQQTVSYSEKTFKEDFPQLYSALKETNTLSKIKFN